mmetsp:Transcript_3900/g.7022  ORF Transcript_3900/g.7022 Transcript_3900/m.7022 type:complete len:177 (+) Transcript_3900:673-1203(+)
MESVAKTSTLVEDKGGPLTFKPTNQACGAPAKMVSVCSAAAAHSHKDCANTASIRGSAYFAVHMERVAGKEKSASAHAAQGAAVEGLQEASAQVALQNASATSSKIRGCLGRLPAATRSTSCGDYCGLRGSAARHCWLQLGTAGAAETLRIHERRHRSRTEQALVELLSFLRVPRP